MGNLYFIVIALLLSALAYFLGGAKGRQAMAGLDEARRREQEASAEAARLRAELESARIAEAMARTLSEETGKRLEDEKRLLGEAEAKLKDAFKSLAGDALKDSVAHLRGLTEQMLSQSRGDLEGQLEARKTAVEGWTKSLGEQVEALRRFSEEVSRRQQGGEARIGEMLKVLNESQERLSRTTSDLSNALSSNQSRGDLGEMVLEQLLQWAGLSEGTHYLTQSQADAGGGKSVRPDIVVRLPDNRELLVDSKMVLDAYLQAQREDDPVKRAELYKVHAANLKATIDRLSAKDYAAQFPRAADFVVLFLPNDALLSSALQADPSLLGRSFAKKVALATPSTLLPMVKLIDRSWQDSKLADNARQVAVLAGELLDRLYPFIGHVADVGADLEAASAAYNRALGSLEKEVFPQMRKVRELGVSVTKLPKEKEIPKAVEVLPETARVPRLKEKFQEEMTLELE